MAVGVQARNREAVREAMRDLENKRVEARIHIGQRKEDPVESIVADRDRRGTRRVARAARNTIRARALNLIPISARLPRRHRIAGIKRVTRNKAIQINRAGQLATPAALIAESEENVSKRFELRLQRIYVYVRRGFIFGGSKNIDFGNRTACRISAERAVACHAELQVGIRLETVRARVGADGV